jgi:hypothetical protein
MNAKMFCFWTAVWVLFLIPPYFIWHKVYKDGVIGRLALGLLSFAAGSFLLEGYWGETKYDMLTQTVLLVVAFAMFLVWHLFRWHRRVGRRNIPPPVLPEDRRKLSDRRFAS